MLVSPIRVVCANTQAAAIRSAKSSYSIRHTAGATGQIAQARAALGLTWAYAEAFEQQAEQMIARTISTDEFTAIVAQLWPVDQDAKRSKTIADNRRYQLVGLLRHSPTGEDIRGTRWAAYQAITEYADHVAPVGDKWNPQAARAERAVTSSSVAQVKTRAFDLLAN